VNILISGTVIVVVLPEMKKTNRKNGYTLMELVVAAAILGVLAAFAVPTYIKINQEAKMRKTVSDINMAGNAVVQKFHELAGVSSEWPSLAGGVGTLADIVENTAVFDGTGSYSTIYWTDLFSGRRVPRCPIDNQPYKMYLVSKGQVDYITGGSGTMTANVTDPEFYIMWISQDSPADTVMSIFRP
jgi:prepilin-type N-terminal cleavage/methylation domain-containing protein